MISQPVSSSFFFFVLHCLLGLGELQACPFPDVVFPLLLLSANCFNLTANEKQTYVPTIPRKFHLKWEKAALLSLQNVRFMDNVL